MTQSRPADRHGDPSWDGEALLGRAERIVAMARSRGAPQAEAYLELGAALGVDIEAGRIAATGTSQGSGGSIRIVAEGGRVGFAYFTHEDKAPAAIDAALRNARFAEANGYHLPPATGRTAGLAHAWDPEAAALDVDAAVRMARDGIAGAAEACPDGLVSGGGAGLDWGVAALASTEGVAAWNRETGSSVSIQVVLEDGERSVSAGEGRQRHGLDLDAHAVGHEAGTITKSLRTPADLPKGGRFDVVLTPPAASELVVDLALSAVMGDEARRGKTVWSNKLGQTVAHAGLSVVDDPLDPHALGGATADGEGQATRHLPILDAGVLRTFLFDTWDAHRHHDTPTRSAVRGGFKSLPSTGTHHVAVTHRTTLPRDRLLADIDDGLLVESVLGAHTANVTTGDFSVTSPNVWRIQAGQVVGPVREVALSGNLPELLGRLDAASTDPKRTDGLTVPHLRLRGVDVSI